MILFLAITIGISVLICAIIVKTFYSKKSQQHDSKKLILPGPISLPFIGAAIQIGLAAGNLTNFELAKKLCTKYGSVMGFQAGVQYFALVEDFDTAKVILNSEIWSGRVPLNSVFFSFGFSRNLGILMSSGEIWKGSRRLVLRALREFGFGEVKTMTKCLEEEVGEFLQQIEEIRTQDSDICMHQAFNLVALNVLWRVMSSQRFTPGDKEMLRLIMLIKDTASLVSVGTQPLFAFPFLRYIPGATPHGKIKKLYDELIEFFRKIIEQRRLNCNHRTKQNDFIDYFLKKIDDVGLRGRRKSSLGINRTIYSDENLIQCSIDLLMAGVDTTPNTMEFVMLYLIKYPEVQRKVQEEVDSVIGSSRSPTPNDRVDMPYTEAVIMEVMRQRSVTPLNARTALEDTTLNGYYIPKNTMVGINFVAIHNDEKLWGDPNVFRPERFIDSNNKIVKDHKVLAFGAGKRVCAGFSVSKATTFVLLAALMQKYTFKPSKNYPELSLEANTCGVTIMPKPYYSHVQLRSAIQ